MDRTIEKLRKILHTTLEKYPKIDFESYEPYDKIEYTIDSKHIDYIKYFVTKFSSLREIDKQKVLEKKSTNIYKIYEISKDDKKYIGSTSSSLFYFLRFNLFLFYSEQKSVFDILGAKDPLGVKVKLLEIVKPNPNTRKLVDDRKKFHTGYLKLETVKRDTSVVDAYIALYNSFLCRPVQKKRTFYVYRIEQVEKGNNIIKSLVVFLKRKSAYSELKEKLHTKFKFNKKQDLKVEFIEKIVVSNSLEEDIMKDRYRIVYNPSMNNRFCLKELDAIKDIKTQENVDNLKRHVFLRVNKLVMTNRYKKYFKKKNFIYSITNKINGRGGIKYFKDSLEELIETIYDKAIKQANDPLSKDLQTFPEKEFKIKILRELKPDDNIKIVMKRFENRFNLKGYSLNLRQIYSIINNNKRK